MKVPISAVWALGLVLALPISLAWALFEGCLLGIVGAAIVGFFAWLGGADEARQAALLGAALLGGIGALASFFVRAGAVIVHLRDKITEARIRGIE